MQYKINFPEDVANHEVNLKFNSFAGVLTEEELKVLNKLCTEGAFDKLAYCVFSNSPFLSIEKKEGYLHLEIDEKQTGEIK